MAISRVTQNLMTQHSLTGLQTGLSRLAQIQEQLSTGRILNRPSDSPSDTTSAMRVRSALGQQEQFARNGADALGWLNQLDNTLGTVSDRLRRVRDLALQGRNAGTSQTARDALASEVDQIREGLIGTANTQYLGRPIFGGITSGPAAYDSTGAYVGTPGAVNRVIGDGVVVDVQLAGPAVFGPDGASVFDELTALAAGLRAGSGADMDTAIGAMTTALARVTTQLTEVGTRTNRVEAAMQAATDTGLTLTNRLSEIENTDLPKAMVELQMQEVAYQAALASTARVLQPSLVDFLR